MLRTLDGAAASFWDWEEVNCDGEKSGWLMACGACLACFYLVLVGWPDGIGAEPY